MSSIEEDIKRCEQLTRPEHASWIGLSNQNAIKTLLCNLEALCDMQRSADRELQRQKQINEEHQKINGELRERVKELEKENELILNSKIGVDLSYDDYVPRQKIKDKIKEIQEDRESKYYDNFLEERDIEKTVQVLEELLQEEEK